METAGRQEPRALQLLNPSRCILARQITFRGRSVLRVIILAGGYAKRLYPLTENRAKPLISVAGKPMIERVLGSLAPVEDIESIYIVTNDKFHSDFRNWLDAYCLNNGHFPIDIINNESSEVECQIGAIGNLHLVLARENIDDDIIVVAADNLFTESLEGFATFSRQKNAPVVGVYTMDTLHDVQKYGSVQLDDSGMITYFEEKPVIPKSLTIGIALYYYPKSSLSLIKQYIAERNNSEEPGRLVEWMYKRTPFYSWSLPGIWCDVGSIEKLEEANRIFAE